MPKLTEDLFAVADGEIYPRWFRVGDEVTGDVERTARSRGIVCDDQPRKAAPRRKSVKPPENK